MSESQHHVSLGEALTAWAHDRYPVQRAAVSVLSIARHLEVPELDV